MQIIPDLVMSLLLVLPFLVSLVALHLLLWKPMAAYLQGRDAAIGGAKDQAEQLDVDLAAKLEQLEVKIVDANRVAATYRSEARARGLAVERKLVEEARGVADAELSAAVETIVAEKTAAAGALQATAVSLSNDIATRVLGRGVGA